MAGVFRVAVTGLGWLVGENGGVTLGRTPRQTDLLRSTVDFCEGRVAAGSIYGVLHRECFGLFPDEMFADLFTDVGRRSVPPAPPAHWPRNAPLPRPAGRSRSAPTRSRCKPGGHGTTTPPGGPTTAPPAPKSNARSLTSLGRVVVASIFHRRPFGGSLFLVLEGNF